MFRKSYCQKSFIHIVVPALLLATVQCGSPVTSDKAASGQEAVGKVPSISKVHPRETVVGQLFNVQSDGQSAIAVACENATKSTVIVWGDHPLKTVFGSDQLLTATIPQALFEQAGEVSIYLQNETGKSKPATFVVRPAP
jgi:hypothetical protein